ncbi:TPA: LamG domain-containing protein [Candidatus Poribacteria bacterium]|nr:LamG domain-containing protein [Candidatus Poribacteria bacterium]
MLKFNFVINIIGLIAVIITCSMNHPPLYALNSNDVLFYASFDGTLDATLSQGNPQAKPVGKFKYAKGILGRAVYIGQRNHEILYESEGNLRPEQGSISVWVQAISWSQEDKQRHIFWHARGNAHYLLGKSVSSNTYFTVRKGHGKSITVPASWRLTKIKQLRFEPGRWRHLCATWGRDGISLYVDGKLCGQRTEDIVLGSQFQQYFAVGEMIARSDTPDTLIDELIIFRRPITSKEVRYLYQKGTQELFSPGKIVFEDTIDNSQIMPREIPLAVKESRHSKSGKRKESLPVWWNNTVGISDDVPIPWTPIKIEGQRVSVWGRTYEFHNGLFPSQITTQNTPILAAPIRLMSGDSELSDEADIQWIEKAKHRAVIELRSHKKNLEMTAKILIEYDGMMWIELMLNPAKPTKIAPLALEIPLRREHASLICPWDYKTKNVGNIPKNGYRSTFLPAVWIGDESGGIQWFAESQRNWRVIGHRKHIEVIPADKITTLRLNFTDTPFVAEEPMKISFGLIATPVKPRPPEWRTWRIGSKELYEQSNIRIWWSNWTNLRGYPTPKANAVAKMARLRAKSKWKRVCAYTNLSGTSPHSPEFKEFGEEWRKIPSDTIDPDVPVHPLDFVRICPRAKSWQDFYVWSLTKAVADCNFDGLYYDTSSAMPCKNTNHGCGYVDVSGELQPTWNILAIRNMAKRIYTFVKNRDADFFIIFHMSGKVMMPYLSFCDAMLDGENFTSSLKPEKPNYYELLPLDKFRAEFMGHNFGPGAIFLPELKRGLPNLKWDDSRVAEIEHIIGMILLHDTQIWANNAPLAPFKRLWQAFDEFGWDDKLIFHPYWKQNIAVSSSKDVKISVYRKPGTSKTALVVFNDSNGSQEVVLQLKLSKIGLAPNTGFSVRDIYQGDVVGNCGNELHLVVKSRNFRLIALERNR